MNAVTTKRFIATGLLAITLSSTNAMATIDNEPQPHDDTRAGYMLGHGVVGALLGGPLGYGIGLLTGAWVGNKVIDGYESEAALNETSEALAAEQSLNRELYARLQSVGHEVDELQRVAVESLQFQILFRTGKDELDGDSAQRIEQLARFLVREPDLQLQLDGYADPRGDATYNDALSADRAARVASLLAEQGVSGERISINAHGETRSAALEGDLDSYAFERRVDVAIVPAEEIGLADAR